MLASFVMCQSCGCTGRAGNTLSQNQSESPVFPYHGHDPFKGIMRYSCANCKTPLLVDPMDMLISFCVLGVPEHIAPSPGKKNTKPRILAQTAKVLQKIPHKISFLKPH